MRLNQNGISLIELLVAAVLTAAVALGGAYVVSQTQRVNKLATTQSDIDRIHYLHLQIARNVSNIQKLYGIDTLHNATSDPNFLKCLQMSSRAVNCLQYQLTPRDLANVTDSHGNSILPVIPNFLSTVTVSPHCVNGPPISYCDYISINVFTSYTGSPSLNVSSRTSVSNLPNFLFVPRNAIDYGTGMGTGCTVAGQMMVGIDYTNQTPICGQVTRGLDGSSNTQQLPLLVYDSGSPSMSGIVNAANTTVCPYGYASAGFGSSSCSSSTGNLTAPPPVTTTTTTLPPPPTGTQVTLIFASCFVGGTQVTLANGSTKAIEDIKVGEKILTYDEARDRQVISPVVDVFHHPEKDSDLYTMTLSNGTHITSNDVHPFFLADYHQYESAARIYDLWRQGSEIHLLSSKNQIVTVANIEKTVKKVKLYNLHVQSTYDQPQAPGMYGHNYFAGGVLVHNRKCSLPCNVARYDAAESGCCTSHSGILGNRNIGGYPGATCRVDSSLASAVNSCVNNDPAVLSCVDTFPCLP